MPAPGPAARRQGRHRCIALAGASAGISPEHWHRRFDRFYLADQARQRRVPGVGPALSLARDIAKAHGGTLALIGPGPGQVCLRLPLPAA